MNIRNEAYHIIVKVLKNRDYSDTLLHQKTRKLTQNREQVAFLYNLVKGTVKLQLKLDYIARQFTDREKYFKTDLKIKALIYMGLYQLTEMDSMPDHAAVNETVELAKMHFGDGIASFVNSVLRSYLREPRITYPDDDIERIAYMYSYPVEIIREWINLWGADKTRQLAEYFNESSRLHIRVNTQATEPKKLEHYFAKRNIRCLRSPASSNMFVCEEGFAVLDDVTFSEGYFSVQDTSSALIVELLDPQPGESILDLFAAPGGKCTYIAEKLYHTGEVIAVDKSPSKMKLLKQAAERLQITIITLVVQDAFTYGPVAPAYHRVLIDAPCSGWGVFGRKADLRWQKHQNIPELIKIQEKALNYAANFVKKDGYLVYSTCTLNPRENEFMVQEFLKKNDNFRLVSAGEFIPDDYVSNGYLMTIPYKHNMDGAFAAKLQKVK